LAQESIEENLGW